MQIMSHQPQRPRTQRASYHHGNLRQTLITAAARVAASEGVDAIQVKDLAKAAGVSSAAPFRHFATRRDLLVACAEEGARRQEARSEAALVGVEDPLDRAQASAVAYVRWAVEERGYFRLLTRPELLAASPVLQAASARHQAMLAAGLGTGEPASGPLSDRSAAMLAATALVFGLARMLVDGHLGEVSGDEAAALAFQLTEVLGRGLANSLGPQG